MTEALIVVVPFVVIVAAVLVAVVSHVMYRLDECDRMCLELREVVCEIQYAGGHPSRRGRRVWPSPERVEYDPFTKPFSDEGVIS